MFHCFVINMTMVFMLMCHQLRLTEKLSTRSLVLRDTGNEMESCNTCVRGALLRYPEQ